MRACLSSGQSENIEIGSGGAVETTNFFDTVLAGAKVNDDVVGEASPSMGKGY